MTGGETPGISTPQKPEDRKYQLTLSYDAAMVLEVCFAVGSAAIERDMVDYFKLITNARGYILNPARKPAVDEAGNALTILSQELLT